MVENGSNRMRRDGIHSNAMVNGRAYPQSDRASIWWRITAVVIVAISGAVSIGLTVLVIVVIVSGVMGWLY